MQEWESASSTTNLLGWNLRLISLVVEKQYAPVNKEAEVGRNTDCRRKLDKYGVHGLKIHRVAILRFAELRHRTMYPQPTICGVGWGVCGLWRSCAGRRKVKVVRLRGIVC